MGHTDADIIDVPIQNGLVEKVAQKDLPYSAESFYRLTLKGKDLLAEIDKEISNRPEHERLAAGEEMLKTKINLRRP